MSTGEKSNIPQRGFGAAVRRIQSVFGQDDFLHSESHALTQAPPQVFPTVPSAPDETSSKASYMNQSEVPLDTPLEQEPAQAPTDTNALIETEALPDTPHAFAPYQNILPRMSMGWPSTQPVQGSYQRFTNAFGESGLELEVQECEQCEWLTLEIALPWSHVIDRGFAGLAVEISSTPITWAGLQLRIHSSDGSFTDYDGPTMVLLPDSQKLLHVITLPPDLELDETAPPPKLILWMEQHPKVLRLSRAFVL